MNQSLLQQHPYTDGVVIPVESNEVCSICLDNDVYTYKSWVNLGRCHHQFHRHCIDLWLEHHRMCPRWTYPTHHGMIILFPQGEPCVGACS